MASSAQYLSFLFLVTLFSSLQIQARESQLFSKFSRYKNNNNNNNDDNNNNGKGITTGYGLYFQGSGKLSPSTTTTTTTTTNNNNAQFNSHNLPNETPSDESEEFNTRYPNGNYYNKNNGYEQQGMTDTRFLDKSYTITKNNKNNNAQFNSHNLPNETPSDESEEFNTRYPNGNYYNKNNGYEQQGMTDTRFLDKGYTTTKNNNYYYNGNQIKQEGMSDTRFLENGKYYYHVNSENYYPNGYRNSRGVASGNQYSNRGYYSNSMEGYKNQQEDEDEYQENQEDQYVP